MAYRYDDTGYRADKYEFAYDDDLTPHTIHLPGHDMSDADAISAGAAIWIEYELGDWSDNNHGLPRFGFDPPRRVWLEETTVPDESEEYEEEWWGGVIYDYHDSPRPGTRPVTLISPRDTWRHRCAVCGARGATGITPVSSGGGYLDVRDDELVHPVSDALHVWLCRDHYATYRDVEHEIREATSDPCPRCGHALGGHERVDGHCWGPDPFGPGDKEECLCTVHSPHRRRITLDGLRDATAAKTLVQRP